MKNFARRVFGSALAATILLMTAVIPVSAANSVVEAITAQLEGKMPAFTAFNGQVTDVTEESDRFIVSLEGEDESLINFAVTNKTYIHEGVILEAGQQVTGYYDNSLPMPAIYPPLAEAAAFFTPGSAPNFIKMDRFDQNLTSYDGLLKLNVGEDTVIMLQDGRVIDYNADIAEQGADRAMVVFYSVTTRSIPAQTTPSLVVVLFEAAEHPIGSIDPGKIVVNEPDDLVSVLPEEGTMVDLVVGGQIMDSIPLVLVDGQIMVPLYLVCRGLDISLEWDGATQTATLDGEHSITIGLNEYAGVQDSVITLGAPPVIIEDRTFVPLSYFDGVLGLNNAYFFEGQIVIDDFEKMDWTE